jgi:hypothetical protein
MFIPIKSVLAIFRGYTRIKPIVAIQRKNSGTGQHEGERALPTSTIGRGGLVPVKELG